MGMDLLLIPVNCDNVHWTLIVIDVQSRTMTYYDSLWHKDSYKELGALEVPTRVLTDVEKTKRNFLRGLIPVGATLSGTLDVTLGIGWSTSNHPSTLFLSTEP